MRLLLVTAFVGFAGIRPAASGVSIEDDVIREMERLAVTAQQLTLCYTFSDSGVLRANKSSPCQGGGEVVFSGRNFYFRTRTGRSDVTETREGAFDGTTFYLGTNLRKTNPTPFTLGKFNVHDRDEPKRTSMMFDIEYVDALGLYAPERIFEMEHYSGVTALPLWALANATEWTIVREDGNLLIQTRTIDRELRAAHMIDADKFEQEMQRRRQPPEDIQRMVGSITAKQALPPYQRTTFTLDTQRGFMIVGREDRADDGKLLRRMETADPKEYGGSLWLPGRTTLTCYGVQGNTDTFGEEPLRTITFTLKSAELAAGRTDFTLNYTQRGTHVIERRVPEAREKPSRQIVYMVAADGKAMRAEVASILSERRRNLVTVTLTLLIVCVGALVIVKTVYNSKRT